LILIEASPSAYHPGMLWVKLTPRERRRPMRFYTSTHQYYCGIDLHTRMMYLCIISSGGEIVLHRNMKASPENLLEAIQPYRSDIVVGVE
jgi:hypothetical protein